VNNQKAVIKVGSDEFFVTGVRTDTVDTNNSAIQSVNVDLTPFFSGVALDVTPQIDENGIVTLHIHPSVSDVQEKVKEINVSSGDGTLQVPLALSSIRESDSIVRAVSGQVIVIGGLMQTQISQQQAGIPLLQEIPLLGALFRHEKESSVKSELVILLRPIVIDSASQWRSLIQNSPAPALPAESAVDG
jgi:MSHA biogenesis protein MshL